VTTWWTPERLEILESEAISWVGTPFSPNSCSKKFGASCAKLCGALYTAAGFDGIEVPDGQTSHARFNSTSIITPYFDGNDRFEAVRIEDRLPGDVLGFTIGRSIHHMGVLLGGGRFVHSCDHIGVVISSEMDATWISRLARIWRPKP
jgi:cell wall-associated NlpC family hydrolase